MRFRFALIAAFAIAVAVPSVPASASPPDSCDMPVAGYPTRCVVAGAQGVTPTSGIAIEGLVYGLVHVDLHVWVTPATTDERLIECRASRDGAEPLSVQCQNAVTLVGRFGSPLGALLVCHAEGSPTSVGRAGCSLT